MIVIRNLIVTKFHTTMFSSRIVPKVCNQFMVWMMYSFLNRPFYKRRTKLGKQKKYIKLYFTPAEQ